MKRKHIVFIVAICVLLIGTIAFAMGSTRIEQKSVMAGTVSQTVSVGTLVNAGDSLVDISTLTGTTSACRATANGTVKEVLVKVGDEVTPGESVVYLEASE